MKEKLNAREKQMSPVPQNSFELVARKQLIMQNYLISLSPISKKENTFPRTFAKSWNLTV